MTQIRSIAPRPRRPGELGVHSVDHFNFVVPDLKHAQKFYTDFGLDVREEGNALGLYTAGHRPPLGPRRRGPAKKLTYVSFGAYPEDFEGCAPGCSSTASAARSAAGLRVERRLVPRPGRHADRDPRGGEILAQREGGAVQPVLAARRAGLARALQAPFVRPRRLAHILLFSSDVSRAIDFYDRVLGLRLSDRSGDGVAFMHGIHGSDHHMIALAKSDGPGLHHLSWDVGSFHEVGLGAMQMADRGFSAGWGVGRHVLGSNYFHYVRDPWGSYSEYSSDIDYIPVDRDWPSGDHPGDDAFYVWGPTPPADFVANHEIAA